MFQSDTVQSAYGHRRRDRRVKTALAFALAGVALVSGALAWML